MSTFLLQQNLTTHGLHHACTTVSVSEHTACSCVNVPGQANSIEDHPERLQGHKTQLQLLLPLSTTSHDVFW